MEERNYEMLVKQVWRNWTDKGKRYYWVFVSDGDERIACFNSKLIEELGLSTKEKNYNFNPPKKFVFQVKESDNGQLTITGVASESKAEPEKPKASSGYQKDASIDRMNVLRTAVMWMEGMERDIDYLKGVVSLFEGYVTSGKWSE